MVDRAARPGCPGRAALSRRLADPRHPVRDSEGAVELIDFMRPRPRVPSADPFGPRPARAGRDAHRVRAALRLRRVVPWVERLAEGGLSAIGGPDRVMLRTPAALRGEDLKTVGEFAVGAGETIPFVLSWGPSHLPPSRPVDAERALHDTESFWRRWSGRCAPAGPWTETVKRSLIVLKGLTYAPTGGIVAAPTTSLPEHIGGPRNWDYRFCWLRDATFTLLALMHAGYYDEARAWRDWLLRAVAGSPEQLQIMYGIGGERRLTEWEASWLPGYEGSAPVRIGNAAVDQTQLDVYGEMIDALFHAYGHGLSEVDARQRNRSGPPRTSGDDLGPARRRHLGGARAAAALHPLEGDGLGGVRPRGQNHRARRRRRSGRALAADPRRNPRRCLRQGVRPRPRQLCPGLWIERRSMPACCCCRWSASCRRPIRASSAPSRRSSSTSSSTAWCCATTPGSGVDGLPPGEGAFLPCSFWLADNLHPAGTRRRGRRAVRAAGGAAQRCRAVGRGIRSAARNASSAIFRRRSRTSRWSTPPST